MTTATGPRAIDYARDRVTPLLTLVGGFFRMCVLTGKAVFRRRPMPEPEPAGVESQEIPLFREIVPGNMGRGEAGPAGGQS